MPLLVTCPCGKAFRCEESAAGQPVPCPHCGREGKADGPIVPPFDVFLSHSSKDKHVANACCAALEARGVRCWIAPRDIVPSLEWSDAIIRGIEQSRLFVLVFSAAANESRQVMREVERAVAKGLPILPFRTEDVQASKALEYFINCHHWLDAVTPPLEASLGRLGEAVEVLLRDAQAAPPMPRRPPRRPLPCGRCFGGPGRGFWVRRPSCSWAWSVWRCGAPSAPPVASDEVIQARAEVGQAWDEAALDRGQGFGERCDELDRLRRGGDARFDQKQFDEALDDYRSFLEAARALRRRDAERGRLRDSLGKMDRLRGELAGDAPAGPLAGADEAAQAARKHFDAGRFAEAAEAAEAASRAYVALRGRAEGEAAVRTARLAYEALYRTHKAALPDAGDDVREAAQKLARQAEGLAEAGEFARAAAAYSAAAKSLREASLPDVKYVSYFAGFAAGVALADREKPDKDNPLGPDYASKTMMGRLGRAQRGRLFQTSEGLRDRLKREKDPAQLRKLILGELKEAVRAAGGEEAEACFLAGLETELLRMRVQFPDREMTPTRAAALAACESILGHARKGGFPEEAVSRFEKARELLRKAYDDDAVKQLDEAFAYLAGQLHKEEGQRDQAVFFGKKASK